jgi:hypothetical protein
MITNAAMTMPIAPPPTTSSGLWAPRYTRAMAFNVAMPTGTHRHRPGSTVHNNAATPQAMMACPETKESPSRGTSPRKFPQEVSNASGFARS